jgi:hypothetical protein
MVDELSAPEESHKKDSSSNLDNAKTNKFESAKHKVIDTAKSDKTSVARAQAGQSAADAAGLGEAPVAHNSARQATTDAIDLEKKTTLDASASAEQVVTDTMKSARQAASDTLETAKQMSSSIRDSAEQAAKDAANPARQASAEAVKPSKTSFMSNALNVLKSSKYLIPTTIGVTSAIVLGTVIVLNSLPASPVAIENESKIQGNLTFDWINLEKFTPDTSVTIEIFENESGPMVGNPHMVQTDSDGNVSFDGREFETNLQPGMYILATDDDIDIVYELLLEDLSIDVFDTDLDIVAGKAPPEALLLVNVHDETIDKGYGMETTADSDGNWSADFMAELNVDLNENMNPQVTLSGEGGDGTIAEFPGYPSLQGNLALDWVSASLLTPDSSATLWIYESDGGPQVTGSPFTIPTNWLGEMTFEGSENGVDLKPEMYIVVQDNDRTALEKEIVLEDVVIEAPDYMNNVLKGTGPENTMLTVEVFDHTNGDQYILDVQTDDDGNWIVDFTAEFGVEIPNGDECVHIKLYDEDGDSSVADPIGLP